MWSAHMLKTGSNVVAVFRQRLSRWSSTTSASMLGTRPDPRPRRSGRSQLSVPPPTTTTRGRTAEAADVAAVTTVGVESFGRRRRPRAGEAELGLGLRPAATVRGAAISSLRRLRGRATTTTTASFVSLATAAKTIGLGLGGVFAVANVGFLASALPAVTGRGAPYMPTFRRSLDLVFDEALPAAAATTTRREESRGDGTTTARPLRVVDLGSGDGRVVVEAARRGHVAVGHELNFLLVWASRAWAFRDRPRARASGGSATFLVRNLWNADLRDADVVFVYGLAPIMARLGRKILDEAPDHCVVVSNVFEMRPTNQWREVFRRDEVRAYVRATTSDDDDEGECERSSSTSDGSSSTPTER